MLFRETTEIEASHTDELQICHTNVYHMISEIPFLHCVFFLFILFLSFHSPFLVNEIFDSTADMTVA